MKRFFVILSLPILASCGALTASDSDTKGVYSKSEKWKFWESQGKTYLNVYADNKTKTACFYYNAFATSNLPSVAKLEEKAIEELSETEKKQLLDWEKHVFLTSQVANSYQRFAHIESVQRQLVHMRGNTLQLRVGIFVGGMLLFGPSLLSIPSSLSILKYASSTVKRGQWVGALSLNQSLSVNDNKSIYKGTLTTNERNAHPAYLNLDEAPTKISQSLMNDVIGAVANTMVDQGSKMCPTPATLYKKMM